MEGDTTTNVDKPYSSSESKVHSANTATTILQAEVVDVTDQVCISHALFGSFTLHHRRATRQVLQLH